MYPGVFSTVAISLWLLISLVFVSVCSWVPWLYSLGSVITSSFYGDVTELVLNQTTGELRKGGVTLSPSNGTMFSDFRFRERALRSTVLPTTASSTGLDDSSCDLYHGQWYYDESVTPLYTNKTCPILRKRLHCQGNGRPDKEYENWRWKPFGCELPQFSATKFLQLMSGKTRAFVGDSLAHNQMESLMCTLWQVEVPENTGNSTTQRWYFRSKSVTIMYIVSEWLVKWTRERYSNVRHRVHKVRLDTPDGNLMRNLPSCDVVILCNGHWFQKPQVFLWENKIVGTHSLSLPAGHHPVNVSNSEAFRISTETVLTAMATHPNYTGLTIVVPYTPDHFKNGEWNTGGSCNGNVKPLPPGKFVENKFTAIMHEKQVTGFNQVTKKQTNKSRMKLMDITKAFEYRHDGHPGPYHGNPSRHGRPPPEDCVHWCLPGPVDIWNEFMLEILRKDLEENHNSVY